MQIMQGGEQLRTNADANNLISGRCPRINWGVCLLIRGVNYSSTLVDGPCGTPESKLRV
jgi:hypothetical protein